MKDNNCIFCKLANGEIPTATIYEDEDFRVIRQLRDMHSSFRKNIMPIFMSWMMSLRENQ